MEEQNLTNLLGVATFGNLSVPIVCRASYPLLVAYAPHWFKNKS